MKIPNFEGILSAVGVKTVKVYNVYEILQLHLIYILTM